MCGTGHANRRIIYVLCIKAALRIRGALRLRYDEEHFHLAGGWIRIPAFKGKRRGSHLVIVDGELHRELERYLEWRRHRARDEALVVTLVGNAFNPDSDGHLRRGMASDLQRAGITSPITFHCFRHYFSHYVKDNGINTYWWNVLRGDVPKGNLSVYIHPMPEQIGQQYLRYAARLP